jgi:putative protease
MAEIPIGKVTHFFGRLNVAALNLTDTLRVGDTIHVLGRTTDLTERVDSMEIEHQSIQQAGPGDDVAIRVTGRVREHDTVYKVIP